MEHQGADFRPEVNLKIGWGGQGAAVYASHDVDYVQTPSYRALFLASLMLSGRDKVDVLVTGLPVSQWLDASKQEALAKKLTGWHRATPRHEVEVSTVWVVPQPIGGYLDLLWSGQGGSVLEEGRVLVIDPGFFSVDWVLIEEGDIRRPSSRRPE